MGRWNRNGSRNITGAASREKYYREKLLQDLIKFIHEQHQVSDILLAGDLNSCLHEDDIQDFFNRTGLNDVFSYFHDIDETIREPTFIRGPRCIDTLAATMGLLDFFDGIRIMNFSEIVLTDHRGIMADIDINAYFEMETSTFDVRLNTKFDPRRRKHCSDFCEKAEELAAQIKLDEMITNIETQSPSYHAIECVDKEFTYIFNRALTHAAGIFRTI